MAVAVTQVSSDTAVTTVSGGTQTFSGLSFGAATVDRLLFGFVFYADGNYSSGSPNVTGVTIGGVAAVAAIAPVNVIAPSAFQYLNLTAWWAPVPTGTSGSLVATHTSPPNNQFGISCDLYSVTGADTSNPVASSNSAVDVTNSAHAISASLAIPGGGAGIGYAASILNPATAATWTNLTKNNEFQDNQLGADLTFASSTSSGSATRTATFTNGALTSQGLGLILLGLQGPFTPRLIGGEDDAGAALLRRGRNPRRIAFAEQDADLAGLAAMNVPMLDRSGKFQRQSPRIWI